jgi:hypothetical protein
MPELEWAGDLVRMVQVSLAGYAVGGAFVGLAYFDLPYHLMAVVVICDVITKQEQREIVLRGYEVDSAQAPDAAALAT